MENRLKDINELKEELKEEFGEGKKDDNLSYIKFYEVNIKSIDNIDISIDDDHYGFKLRLICEYGLCLVAKGQYTKGVSILDKAVPMFENAPNQNLDELKNSSYFQDLLWSYGSALWQTKQNKHSTAIFNRLVNYYPDNDRYRNWLEGLEAAKIKRYTYPFWSICAIWLIGEFTFFEIFNLRIQYILAIIGGVLFLIALFLELYIYVIKRKKLSHRLKQK